MDPVRNSIQSKRSQERKNLLGNFTNAEEVIQKGISQAQFNEQYGTDRDWD